MEEKCFKAVNFDLDTHQLSSLYPGDNYRKSYKDLQQFFEGREFIHRQGSGYQ